MRYINKHDRDIKRLIQLEKDLEEKGKYMDMVTMKEHLNRIREIKTRIDKKMKASR